MNNKTLKQNIDKNLIKLIKINEQIAKIMNPKQNDKKSLKNEIKEQEDGIFNLSTHFIVINNKKGIGNFEGKVKLNKSAIIQGFNVDVNDNIPIVGIEIIGTPEEIMKQTKMQLAATLTKAKLQENKKGKYSQTDFEKTFNKLINL